MSYFKDCQTLEEIKVRYKQLAKEHHPDCGGDVKTMQEINAAYKEACSKAFKDDNLSEEEAAEQLKYSEEYLLVIEKLTVLPEILIEVVAHWIWVTGNTYPVKKQLKEAGLFFASKKVAWYYRSEEYKTKGGNKTLDEIKAKYGAEAVSSKRKHFIQ